jgi:hypothetical protein
LRIYFQQKRNPDVPSDIPTTSVDISHHLQRQILLRLRQDGSQTYQQIKPDGVEGNAYNYHLRELKKSHLISQDDEGYRLTPTGQLVSDAFSFKTGRLMLRPHHYIALLITQNDQVLVYEPIRRPLAGFFCLPSGKLHYGDSCMDGIAREVERRNLSSQYDVQELCPVNVRYLLNDEVAIQRPGTIWHIDYRGERVERQTESGKTAWHSWTEMLDSDHVLPEVSMALTRLSMGTHLPIDLTYSLDR